MPLRLNRRKGFDSWGRSLMNKMARPRKHNLDRVVDKRARRLMRREMQEQLTER